MLTAVLLLPTVIRWFRYLDHATNVSKCFALGRGWSRTDANEGLRAEPPVQPAVEYVHLSVVSFFALKAFATVH